MQREATRQNRTDVLSEDVWRILAPCEVEFDEQIARIENELIRIRRHLHAHPEPSGEEVETSKYVVARLEELDLKPRLCRGALGVIVDLDVGCPGPETPLIAIRGDLDALRIPDEKEVEYRSQRPGVAHACGHDAHTAILLGTALAVSGVNGSALNEEKPFGARLRLIFQPAEEISSGAEWLVEQGAVDGADAILGLHVDPERPVGHVGIRYGILTANCDEVEIVVEGRGGHAARPHHTIDPVAAAAHLVSTLYEFLPRSVDSRSPSVLTIGQIQGGYAPNVIPERVELLGTLRTTGQRARKRLKQRIEEICASSQHASGASIHVQFIKPLKAVDNDATAAAALEEASRRVVGPYDVAIIDQPSMGGEDFSVYLDHVPGAMLRLGCGVPEAESPFLHSPIFDIDERTLALGTKILIRAALVLSLNPPPRKQDA